MPATVPEIIKMFYNCAGERQTFACRILTPINAGLPHLAWHGAELERDGIRKASLHYGTADRRYVTADRRYGTADRRYGMADRLYGTADRRYGTTDLR